MTSWQNTIKRQNDNTTERHTTIITTQDETTNRLNDTMTNRNYNLTTKRSNDNVSKAAKWLEIRNAQKNKKPKLQKKRLNDRKIAGIEYWSNFYMFLCSAGMSHPELPALQRLPSLLRILPLYEGCSHMCNAISQALHLVTGTTQPAL